ncbi:MAG: hypothetical protein VKL39_21695 [Leptolyngbyaceae bacterium]|nr:hypothetical protein [Leptolyngbyaceae bacterium]
MITPVLEKLILAGLADFRTFNIGASSSSQLTTAEDKVTILTGILWNDFLWNYVGDANYVPNYHVQLILTDISNKRTNVYTINPRARASKAVTGGSAEQYQDKGEPIYIPCYHIFNGSIQFEIVGGYVFNGTTIPLDFGPVTPQVGNLPPPLGTRGANVARLSVSQGNNDIRHNGDNDIVLSNNANNEYRIGTDPGTLPAASTVLNIIDGALPGRMAGCPAATMQLVQINSNVYERLIKKTIEEFSI